MIRKFYSLVLIAGLFAGCLATAGAQTGPAKSARPAPAVADADLSRRLPDSDLVVVINVQRVLQNLLPQLLAGNQAKMDEINAHIDQLKQKTGIDARAFQDVAVGARYVLNQAKQSSIRSVVLARGDFKAPALVAAARIAANGKVRDVKQGGKTITVISVADLKEQVAAVAGSAPTNGPDKGAVGKIVDRVLGDQAGELAVYALDQNVLAFGDLVMVQDAIADKHSSSANSALINLAERVPDSVIGIGGNVPADLAKQLDLDNDQIKTSLSGIRQAYGAVTYSTESYSLLVGAKTTTPAAAGDLKDTIEGLQAIGGFLVGQLKDVAIRKVAQHGMDNLKVTQTGAEMQMQLAVPQDDASTLVGLWK